MMFITLMWYFASIHLFFFLSIPMNLALGFNLSVPKNIKCVESERQALLSFKQGLVDKYDILSSWEIRINNDCCNWRGVRCSNKTEGYHVIGIDLHGSDDKFLMGEVGSSLAQLSHVNYLDLSHNYLDRILLEDIGSLINLNYLNLSHNQFASIIPPHLGNLSSLSSLKHLDLSSVDLHKANDWASAINQLPILQRLSLSECNLSQPIGLSHSSYTNFSKFLVELDLSSNDQLNSSIYNSWLINFTSLVHLNLAFNNLKGLNFDDFGNMTSLVFLDLTSTKANFRSLKSFKSLRKLNSLYLPYNNIGGLLSDFFRAFPLRVLNSLQYLNLASNNFFGFLPNFTMLPSLKILDLSYNMLNGTIPPSLGQLSNLEYLNLHLNSLSGIIPQSLGQLSNLKYLDLFQNSLEGEVSEAHFSRLTNLKYLDLFNNSLNLSFKTDWIPPFQLDYISLGYCKLGPFFPKWFRTQNLSSIDISFSEISDIIPQWFWNNLSPKLHYMDFSGNKMTGEIPNNLSLKFELLSGVSLKSNNFVGRIPAFLFQVQFLDLSSNDFSDLSGLCEIVNSPGLIVDLSNNQLSGQLPNCWDSMLSLVVLNLSSNYFSGELPHSMGNLVSLDSLFLRDNQFSGGLHLLFNLTNLEVVDATNNGLSGTIPSWIGSRLLYLTFLNLKSNHFHGSLPLSLCNLRSIQVLDISSNNVSGSIPTCIRNFSVLAQTSYENEYHFYYHRNDIFIVWKGQERLITGQLMKLERNIDLSSNHLTGKIPNEITELVGLVTLNLSRNELTGQIPDKIGQLQSLESLDLSINHLSGPIPSSVSKMSTLGVLKLSYNNLSGKIPTGTQLQSFPTSSYEGNPYLCGDPLKKCFEETAQDPSINNVHVGNQNENDKKFFVREFMISMLFGFIVGFWGIFGSLVLNRRWRHAYFQFFRCTNN